MRIRRLVLYGFKSFPDRTTLELGPGVSCIVGPNGCGKSNIVDAIKWCVGEQSARSLRGEQMQDVIFAGSADRAPVGYAEVSITFSSAGGAPFPGQYARFEEVEVTRRLHRTGASEYLLNQVRVRRRDIVDLFLDTGVGNDLYSFIEQGRIGKIVHARPSERRSLIDEAAGISSYKARRAEARSKLEATAGQLDRAADLADELGRRLAVLRKAVVRAHRYRRARAVVRQREIGLGLVQFSEFSADRRALRRQRREARGRLAALERERTRRQNDIASRRGEIEVAEAVVTALRDEVSEIDAAVASLQGQRSFLERRGVELAASRERGASDLEAAERSLEAARLEIEQVTCEQEEVGERLGVLAGALEEARSAVALAQERVAGSREALRGESKRLESIERRTTESRARLTMARERMQALEARRAEATGESTRVAESESENRRETEECQERSSASQAELERLEALSEEAVGVLAEAERNLAELERTLRREESRLDGEVRLAQGEAREAARMLVDAETRVESARRSAFQDVEALRERLQQEAARSFARDEEARRARIQAGKQRGRQWLGWVREASDRRVSEAVSASARAVEQRRRADAEHLAMRNQEVTALEEVRVARTLSRLEAGRASASDFVAELEDAAHRSSEQCVARAASLAEVGRELGIVEARHTAVLERLADGSDHAADEAVAAVLPEATTVLSTLETHEMEKLGGVVADVLALPVASTPEEAARAAGAAVAVGRTRIAWHKGPLFDGVQEADTLAEGLALFERTGRPIRITETDVWIDGRGVIHIGDGAGERLSDAKAARTLQLAWQALEQKQGALTGLLERERRVERDAADVLGVTRQRMQVLEEQIAAFRATLSADSARRRAQALAREEEQSLARLAEVRDAGRRAVDAARAEAGQEVEICSRRIEALVEDWSDALYERAVREREASESRVSEEVEVGRRVALAALSEAEQALDGQREECEAIRGTVDQALSRAEEARAQARAVRSECAATVEQARERVSRARRRAGEQRLDVELVRRELEHLEAERARLASLSVDWRSRGASTVRELEEARGSLEGLTVEVLRLEAETERQIACVAEHQSEVEKAETEAGEARSAREAAAVSSAAAEQASMSLTRQRDLATQRAEDARERMRRASEQAKAWASEESERRARLTANEEEAATAQERRTVQWAKLQEAREAIGKMRGGLDAALSALESLSADKMTLDEQIRDIELRSSEVERDLDALKTRIDERYQLSLAGLLDRMDASGRLLLEAGADVAEPVRVGGRVIECVEDLEVTPSDLGARAVVEEWVAELTTARQALEKIGPVNLAVIEEFEEVFARHEELASQRADLEGSIQRIRSAIAKMNRICRERFRDTFDRVDERFRELYPELVGGGRAHLALTNEDDLLETGVEIFVEPPGKRLQSLTLLSGGEKAMAAIAMILSLFEVKPSPFCILDEVDAPLDEANGSRFNGIVRKMSEISQFLVVTHNRKTMESADTLYGITMPSPGASAVVSVQLQEITGPARAGTDADGITPR